LDAPIVFKDVSNDSTWKPENYERTSYGQTLFRTALVKSRNLVTIRIAREIGIDTVIQRAKDFGLQADFPRDLSVSLGSASVSLMHLCQAYTGFARQGSTVKPRWVSKVTDSWGKEFYISQKQTHPVLTAQTAYIITYLLQQVVQDGTGWRVRALQRPVAGKTGTTDEQKDAWFIGYTPYLLTGVYVGFDDPRPMGKYETGSRAAVQEVERPPGIVMARIDAQNGLLAGSGTERSYLLPFKAGTQPHKISPDTKKENAQVDAGGDAQHAQEGLKDLF
jgi:penicillin-binding protein 1A